MRRAVAAVTRSERLTVEAAGSLVVRAANRVMAARLLSPERSG